MRRRSTSLILLSLAGCGNGTVFVMPEDCVLFSRGEARSWFDLAVSERSDGASELEAFGKVLLECVQGNCDGSTAGVCAVSCASCTDALVTLVYP